MRAYPFKVFHLPLRSAVIASPTVVRLPCAESASPVLRMAHAALIASLCHSFSCGLTGVFYRDDGLLSALLGVLNRDFDALFEAFFLKITALICGVGLLMAFAAELTFHLAALRMGGRQARTILERPPAATQRCRPITSVATSNSVPSFLAATFFAALVSMSSELPVDVSKASR